MHKTLTTLIQHQHQRFVYLLNILLLLTYLRKMTVNIRFSFYYSCNGDIVVPPTRLMAQSNRKRTVRLMRIALPTRTLSCKLSLPNQLEGVMQHQTDSVRCRRQISCGFFQSSHSNTIDKICEIFGTILVKVPLWLYSFPLPADKLCLTKELINMIYTTWKWGHCFSSPEEKWIISKMYSI